MESYGSEKVVPYNSKEQKGAQIERMFDAIAGTYDQLNRTISLGFDKGWRRKGIRYLTPFQPQQILDIATGTGDMPVAIYRMLQPEHITGVDISEGMMEIARRKVEKAGYTPYISFEQQDCTALTLADNSFDAVTAAFGVRNFENIKQGLSEMYRVLKPGGHVMILELSEPELFPIKQFYRLYTKTFLPYIGRAFSKSKEAYDYLPESIKVVPQGKVMTGLLDEVGFTETTYRTFTFGVCSMYTGKK